jgi:hypothetical protein
MRMSSNSRLLIAGIIRNGSKTISNEISVLKKAFSDFQNIEWLIIESDSADDTVNKLDEIKTNTENFRYESLGNLSDKLKSRTERIAFCRNVYLEKIRNDSKYIHLDYVVIVDLDGVNSLLTQKSVQSCFAKNNWDVCTANQSGNYYDIWALRHPSWCPNDCWEQYRYLLKYSDPNNPNALALARYAAVYSKMIRIPADSEWIKVNSAFGGLAIYKKEALISTKKYIGLTEHGMEICDHVSLHLDMTERGLNIYINPELINIDFTEHSEPARNII